MCIVYGVCPIQTAAQPQFNLHDLSVKQVVSFIASLQPGGSRDTCQPGCTTIELFNTTLFEAHGWNGKRLAAFMLEHEARFTSSVVHNVTAREAHCTWLASHKVLPEGLKGEQYLALATRLQGALKSANASLDGGRAKRAADGGSGGGSGGGGFGGGGGAAKRRLKIHGGGKRARHERVRQRRL